MKLNLIIKHNFKSYYSITIKQRPMFSSIKYVENIRYGKRYLI